MSSPRLAINCAVCGAPCEWFKARPDSPVTEERFGGWYCERCDVYSETDVEVEE